MWVAGKAREASGEQCPGEPSLFARHLPQCFPKHREKHNQRDSECWWALLSAGEGSSSMQGVWMPGRSIFLPVSPGGRLGNSLSSPTPCSIASPHHILHQKQTNKQTNQKNKFKYY